LHTGNSIQSKFKENAPNDPKYMKKANKTAIKEFEIQPQMDTIFFVHSGGIMLRDCTVTLKSMPKKLKSKIPAIVALPNSFVNLTNTEVIGHERNHNAGLILLNADAMIS